MRGEPLRRAGERPALHGYRGGPISLVGAGPRPARGRTLCAPTVETGPGTLVRKRQAQKHNRTNSNFLPAQAPSGAGRDRTQALLILRAGTVLPASRGNPRKMGSGESGPMDLGGAKRSRSPSAASPVAFCLLFRHGKRRSPPAGSEISRAQRAKSELCPLIRPLRGHLPPRGMALWGRGPHPPRGMAELKSGR